MATFFDTCIEKIISHSIADERKNIEGAGRFFDGHNTSSSVNILGYVNPIYDDFTDAMNRLINERENYATYYAREKGIVSGWNLKESTVDGEVTPWWLAASNGFNAVDYVALHKEGDRYYPVIVSWYALLNVFTHTIHVLPQDFKFNSIKDEDKLAALANFIDLIKVRLENNCIKSDYGKYQAYSAYDDALRFSTEKSTCKLEQFFWFVPKDKTEEYEFSMIIENQNKIKKLTEEYACLGLFGRTRKKEIVETVDKMNEYAKLVVAKACLNKIGEDFCKEDAYKIANAINSAKEMLGSYTEKFNRTAFTAFAKKKEYKSYIDNRSV